MSDISRPSGLPQAFFLREVHQETAKVRRYTFDRVLPAQPGQFVMAWLPGVDEKPFSIMQDAPLTLAVARVGLFTEALERLPLGGTLWLRGPFGSGFHLVGERLLLVAGGYGAAPLYFLAQRARREGRMVKMVCGARTADDLLLVEAFRRLGCMVSLCTDDGSAGLCGMADVAVETALREGAFDGLYACGPAPMLAAVERIAQNRRLPAQLSREAYMRCGIGVCGSCTCGDRLVCRDGPVFDVALPAS